MLALLAACGSGHGAAPDSAPPIDAPPLGVPIVVPGPAPSGTKGFLASVVAEPGTTYTWTGKKLPRHWKSVLMQLTPYGTDYQGATWKREHTS